MTMSDAATPAPFTSDDYTERMSRVVKSAASKGLAGVIVMPGPDLLSLAGYQPPAVTERLTMLVLTQDDLPKLLVPMLERPDAESGCWS